MIYGDLVTSFREIENDPSCLYPRDRAKFLMNYKERQKFKKWLGTKFQIWYEKAHEHAIKVDDLEEFTFDWEGKYNSMLMSKSLMDNIQKYM